MSATDKKSSSAAAKKPAITQWIPEAIRFGQDEQSGAEIEQLTSDAVTSTNIYCEQRYTSADGSRIAISRKPFGQPNQLWVCDLTTMKLTRVGHGDVLGSNAPKNALYYRMTKNDGAGTEKHETSVLMKLNFLTLESHEMFTFDNSLYPRVGAVSPDEKTLIGGPFQEEGDAMYSMYLFDIATGKPTKICTVQDMFNPHSQFDLAGSGLSIIQLNHAAHRKLEGVNDGVPGAALAIVDTNTGKVIPLPAGRPATPGISGHECWAGTTGEVLFTAGQYGVTKTSYVTLNEPPECEKHLPPAAIYGARPGDKKPRVVAQGKLWNHLAASDDGRFFIADDHTTGRIYVGSIATGKHIGLCDSHTRQGVCQYSHVHAYMTPDNKWVIFNSIVTGVAQVYAARVPEGFLDQLV